jgi:hypothetical protein
MCELLLTSLRPSQDPVATRLWFRDLGYGAYQAGMRLGAVGDSGQVSLGSTTLLSDSEGNPPQVFLAPQKGV